MIRGLKGTFKGCAHDMNFVMCMQIEDKKELFI